MYTYIVSTRTYISEKHADDEDYSDQEDEETQLTDHITNICFVSSSVKTAIEKAKTYNFGETPVVWEKHANEAVMTKQFNDLRKMIPERPDMSITEHLGYIMKHPHLEREFVTITQVPLLD